MVEFKDEEFVKKAILTMNKHDLSGRPLKIKEVGRNFLNVNIKTFALVLAVEMGFG